MDKKPIRRLAFFLPNLDGGGAERVMVNLANYFVGQNYHVDLVVATRGGVFASSLSTGVTFVELGAVGCRAAIPALTAYLRKAQPQVLISTLNHANIAALVARRLAGGRCRVVVREANTIHPHGGSQTRKAVLLPTLMRLLYPLADFAVANSEGVAAELVEHIRLRPAKVRVIENPVYSADFDRLAAADLTDDWLSAATIPVLVGCGRLTAQKDFATLIRAVGVVRQTRPVRLIILGEGEERESLTELIRAQHLEDCVRLPGFVSNPFPYFRLCACFVLSSRYEGCPNVLIQALLAGAQTVSTDCPWGPREVLVNGRHGRLVPPGDFSQMAAAILQTLGSGERGQSAARLELKGKYDIQAVAGKFAALFGDLT